MKSLFKGIHLLNDDETKKLNEAYLEMINECFYEYIDNYFKINNMKLRDILIAEPGWMGQAGINDLGDLKFADISQITVDNLKHEWIHLYQKQFHSMTTFGDKRGMMEFELALIQDILKFIEIKGEWKNTAYSWACSSQKHDKYRLEYMEWLIDLTDNGKRFPIAIENKMFQYFSIAFGEVSISYNTNRGYIYNNGNYMSISIQSLFIQAESFCSK